MLNPSCNNHARWNEQVSNTKTTIIYHWMGWKTAYRHSMTHCSQINYHKLFLWCQRKIISFRFCFHFSFPVSIYRCDSARFVCASLYLSLSLCLAIRISIVHVIYVNFQNRAIFHRIKSVISISNVNILPNVSIYLLYQFVWFNRVHGLQQRKLLFSWFH